ncbi:MAG: hypothetical protein GTO60_19455 [Gammaproteobacteria bacterium]|nr:hypothetical protein [Gammaproteobacteria bacterium]
MNEQMMLLEEAAKALKTTPLNILMHVKRGMLVGVEEEGGWMIDKNSLTALIAKTGGSKAEGVCSSGCAKKHACGGGCG